MIKKILVGLLFAMPLLTNAALAENDTSSAAISLINPDLFCGKCK